MTTLLPFTLVWWLLSALQEVNSKWASRQGLFFGNVPIENNHQPYPPVHLYMYQFPYQPLSYQDQQLPYQGLYQPPRFQRPYPQPLLYQKPYYLLYPEQTFGNVQLTNFNKRNLIRDEQHSIIEQSPPPQWGKEEINKYGHTHRQLMKLPQIDSLAQMIGSTIHKKPVNPKTIDNFPEEKIGSPLEEDVSGGPSFTSSKSPTIDSMEQVEHYGDPLNQWVTQDVNNSVYEAILKRVIMKRKHWIGKLKGISYVETNNMGDLMLFKMKFTYLKSNTTQILSCSTIFSGVNSKVFLGKMECKKPEGKIRRRSMGRWTKEDPNDPNWVLPLTIALNTKRTDALLHNLTQISVKVTDEKTMYKITFFVDRIRGHRKILCSTWFEMIKNGVLRPIIVKNFTCEDDGEIPYLNHLKMMGTPREPNISEVGIGKIIAFDPPRVVAYMVPQVHRDRDNNHSQDTDEE